MSLFDSLTPDEPADSPVDPTLSVGELAGLIKQTLAGRFAQAIWVRGETKSVKRGAGGQVYLQLVEGKDEINAVIWSAVYQRMLPELTDAGLTLSDGIELRVLAKVEYYNGRIQLAVVAIDPEHTLGRMAADRDRLLKTLSTEGLLDRQKQLPRPLVPLQVGLVTSLDSAAHHDFVAQLKSSGYSFSVLCCDARMQGVNAPASVVAALTTRAAVRIGDAPLDVIALVRGGGSKTDLAAFDSEAIARCIATLGVAVMTGIGHEIDQSVADEVSHYRCKTPTAVAAALIDKVRGYLEEIEELWVASATRAIDCIAMATAALDRRAGLATRVPSLRLAHSVAALDTATTKISHRVPLVLNGAAARLDQLAAQTRANSLDRSLARGFSLTRRADGSLVRTIADAIAGSTLVTTVADGTITSTVVASTSSTPEDSHV